MSKKKSEGTTCARAEAGKNIKNAVENNLISEISEVKIICSRNIKTGL
jgi:hypothetical protein